MSVENTKKIPKLNEYSIGNKLDRLKLRVEAESLADNYPKIKDFCFKNTEGYCKEINDFFIRELNKQGFDFEGIYYKIIGSNIEV